MSKFVHKSVLSMGSDDVLLKEIDLCVSVWTRQCGKALLNGSLEDYYMQKNQISTVQEWRRQIQADSNHEFSGARESAIKLIEAQRQLDESFSIPRLDDGEVVTTDMGLSIHHLLRLHRFMQKRLVEGAFLPSSAKEQFQIEESLSIERMNSILERSAKSGPRHLLVEMQMAMFKIQDPCLMYFSIYKQDSGFVTEEFKVSQTELGLPSDTSLMTRLYTLFVNVSTDDMLQEGYLVIKLYRRGCLLETEKSTPTSTNFIRPFACGVVSLKSICSLLVVGVQRELPECQIYRPKVDKIETTFSETHELIIQGRFSELEEIPMSKGVKVCVTLVQGAIDSFQDSTFLETEYSDVGLRAKLKDARVTLPLRTEDMFVQQGISRESIYITLKRGDFSQGSKSSAKNIEVTACCVNNDDGSVVPNCISRGVGNQAALGAAYTSTVFYHTNSPVIEETFSIDLAAVPNILACHLFITVAHCSTNTKEKSTKSIFSGKDKKARDIFAFCVLPFSSSKTGGVVIPDGEISLECFNPIGSMTLDDMDASGSVIPADQVHTYLSPERNSKGGSLMKPRTSKNGAEEYLTLGTYVHSVRYVQVNAVNSLMNWKNHEANDDSLIEVIKACGDLPEHILAPCLQECIEMTIAIMYEKYGKCENSAAICQEVFKLFVTVMNVLTERLNDPSRNVVSFLQLPTAGGRGEKVHKSSIQEKNHQKTQENMLDTFIQKIFQSTKSAEILLLRHCGMALTALKTQLLSPTYTPGLYESSLVAIIKDTCLLAHYNFRRNDAATRSRTLSEFTAEIKTIVFVIIQILTTAKRDNRIMIEIRQQFFEVLSISEFYLSISENATAGNQFILTLLGECFANSNTAHLDRMKFIRRVMDTNMFLEIEGRQHLLPTIVTVLIENMTTKHDVDGSLDLLQIVLEQIEILGTAAEYIELVQLLPVLVNVMLEQSSRLASQRSSGSISIVGGVGAGTGASSSRAKARKSVKFAKKESVRRMSCLGNTALVTTNSVRISLENATSCLCSLLTLLDKENVMKVMTGEFAVVTKSRVTSVPSPSAITSPRGRLSPSKSMRVLALDEGIYDNDEEDEQKKKRLGKDFILSLLSVQTIIVKHLIIPKPWLLLSMMVMKTIQNTVLWATEVLVSSSQELLCDLAYQWRTHVPSFEGVPLLYVSEASDLPEISHQYRLANNLTLWSSVFTLALTLVLDEEISLESLEINPARLAYLDKHFEDDIRLPITEAITQCWQCLPDESSQIKFGHLFTIPFLALACSPCAPLSTAGKIFVIDLLRADFVEHQCFSSTASHVYDSVSETLTHVGDGGSQSQHTHGQHLSLIMEKRFLPSYKPLVDFVGDFGKIFSSDPVLNCKYALDFSIEINELKTLLQVLAKYPKTTEFEEERSFAYAKLMEFLSKMNRRDAYIKFAHTLAKEMINFENYVEAANAVLLHSKLLEWTDESEEEAVEFGEDGIVALLPSNTVWERKLNLLQLSVDMMDKGKAWEYCIELLQEIGHMYTHIRPDYLKLSQVLQEQAKLYQRIATEDRFFPTMFRVSYYGRGYDNQSVVNKTFIYRGNPLESIMDFTSRKKSKYPQCVLLPPKTNPCLEEHLEANKQFMQISKVTAAGPEEMQGLAAEDISRLPKYIKTHRQSNNLTCFFYQRPFRKKQVKSANEFLDLWVEKKFLKTSVVFPGHTRRAEVTEEVVVVLNPIEMALIGLEERNACLAEECEEMRRLSDRKAAQSYTMSLSGTVDAAVNGGIKNYESFITGSYRIENPEIAEDIDLNMDKKGDLVLRLKDSLYDQMELLELGISLHRSKCLEAMIPLHAHVELTFGKMKKELNALLDANEDEYVNNV